MTMFSIVHFPQGMIKEKFMPQFGNYGLTISNIEATFWGWIDGVRRYDRDAYDRSYGLLGPDQFSYALLDRITLTYQVHTRPHYARDNKRSKRNRSSTRTWIYIVATEEMRWVMTQPIPAEERAIPLFNGEKTVALELLGAII